MLIEVRRLITTVLKFNSDEKQFTWRYISVFASDFIYVPPKVFVPCGGGWALRAGIGMNTNLPGHPMSITQCYLAMKDTHFIRVVYSFA